MTVWNLSQTQFTLDAWPVCRGNCICMMFAVRSRSRTVAAAAAVPLLLLPFSLFLFPSSCLVLCSLFLFSVSCVLLSPSSSASRLLVDPGSFPLPRYLSVYVCLIRIHILFMPLALKTGYLSYLLFV